MLELLSLIKDSSTPALLIGGGLIFLILAVVGSINSQINVPPARQRVAGVVGVVLLLAGIVIQMLPGLRPSPIGPAPTTAPPTMAVATEGLRTAAPPVAEATHMAPTDTPVAKLVPPPAEILPPTAAPLPEREAPEASLRAYWQAVSERRYADAWPMLSANFRWTTHANNFDAYVQGYAEQGLCGVAPEGIATIATATDYAQLEATMIYRKGADCAASPLGLRFHMAPAADWPIWLIDRVELK